MKNRLREIRKIRKLSQEELAEQLNVSRQTVAKWENGESMPDLASCTTLARLLGITLDECVSDIFLLKTNAPRKQTKYVFGICKIGERGQIVIPKAARQIFNMNPGDNVLLLGDTEQGGMAIMRADTYEVLGEKKDEGD